MGREALALMALTHRDVCSRQQPAVSYANVGQLSLDLLINTLLQGQENAAVRARRGAQSMRSGSF